MAELGQTHKIAHYSARRVHQSNKVKHYSLEQSKADFLKAKSQNPSRLADVGRFFPD